MTLILILLQNDPPTPPLLKHLPRFEEYFSLSLLATSKLRVNLFSAELKKSATYKKACNLSFTDDNKFQ